MSLTTFSTFYFGYEINEDFRYINFDEGGGELTADIQLGSYTAEELATQIKIAMDAVGAFTYFVSFNRSDRSYTISSASSFDLLVSSGTSGAKAFSVFGFTGADRTGTNTYTGDSSGTEYQPQFILQDHISTDSWQKLVKPTVQKTASGRVEVVRFGTEKFLQLNIKYATNLLVAQDGNVIKYNPTGVEELQAFMQFVITKKPLEFMPDIGNRNTFQTVLLEKTDAENDGTGYKLKELYSKNLPNFFETGILVFRLIE